MQFKNIREFLDKINTIYYAIVALPLVLFLLVYLRMMGDGGHRPVLNNNNVVLLIQIFIGLIFLAGIFLAYFIYRKNTAEARLTGVLRKKLERYYASLLIKNSILAGVSLFLVLAMFLTGNNFFVIMYLVTLVIISLNRPSPFSMIKDLKLNKEEQEILIKNHEIP